MKHFHKTLFISTFLVFVFLTTICDELIIRGAAQTINKNTKPSDYSLLTPSDIERAFREIPKTPPTNKKIVDEKFYNVAVARVKNRNGGPEMHLNSDRVFFVKKGKAILRIGGTITDPQEFAPGEFRGRSITDYKEVEIKAGNILSIPRSIPYQVMVEKSDVSLIVVRIN